MLNGIKSEAAQSSALVDMTEKKKPCILLSIAAVVLLCLSLLTYFVGMSRESQAIAPIAAPIEFLGEYSRDNITWQPLTKDADLNALDGDLYLRGNFNKEISGLPIWFYMNYICFSVSVNGEMLIDLTIPEEYAEQFVCGIDWDAGKAMTLLPTTCSRFI